MYMNKFQIILSLAVMSVLCSFILQPKPWDVPDEFKMMKNPVKKTDKVMVEGKMRYNQACAGCHGLKGKGDGEKVKNLANIKPAILMADNVTKGTDGEYFYKIKYGRGQNHSFSGKLDDEAIWSVIYYMKTFANK